MTLRSIPFVLLLLLPAACSTSTSGQGGGSTSSSGSPPNAAGTETCRQACAKFGGPCAGRCDASCVDLGCASITNPDDVIGIRCETSSLTFYYSTSQNSVQCNASGSGTAREPQGEAATAKRVFITSAEYDGDLAGAGGKATGLAGADALCEQAAASADLGGTWKAWLSDSTTDAIDRIDDASPWYNIERSAVLFPNKATLGTKPYETFGPLLLDETGKQTGSLTVAWSGTESGGRASEYVCGDWTSTGLSTYGEYLTPTYAGGWNSGSFKECYAKAALICIEQ